MMGASPRATRRSRFPQAQAPAQRQEFGWGRGAGLTCPASPLPRPTLHPKLHCPRGCLQPLSPHPSCSSADSGSRLRPWNPPGAGLPRAQSAPAPRTSQQIQTHPDSSPRRNTKSHPDKYTKAPPGRGRPFGEPRNRWACAPTHGRHTDPGHPTC